MKTKENGVVLPSGVQLQICGFYENLVVKQDKDEWVFIKIDLASFI